LFSQLYFRVSIPRVQWVHLAWGIFGLVSIFVYCLFGESTWEFWNLMKFLGFEIYQIYQIFMKFWIFWEILNFLKKKINFIILIFFSWKILKFWNFWKFWPILQFDWPTGKEISSLVGQRITVESRYLEVHGTVAKFRVVRNSKFDLRGVRDFIKW
jgi:hypothetical protein